jgi:hypothetical protein
MANIPGIRAVVEGLDTALIPDILDIFHKPLRCLIAIITHVT